jgi:hypothetical protein
MQLFIPTCTVLGLNPYTFRRKTALDFVSVLLASGTNNRKLSIILQEFICTRAEPHHIDE